MEEAKKKQACVGENDGSIRETIVLSTERDPTGGRTSTWTGRMTGKTEGIPANQLKGGTLIYP